MKRQALSEEVKEAKRVVDVWKLLITDDIVNLIVKYTNDKIREDLLKKQFTPQRLAASRYLGLTDAVSYSFSLICWVKDLKTFFILFFKTCLIIFLKLFL